ncbi:NADPH-dependent FMN reductase [Luteimicrobium subarcticum]|nr:NAD(P)H-dependent oxidoreductase [Luteimicrobium subarcticum]
MTTTTTTWHPDPADRAEPPRAVVLVGNPRPGSRTRAVAEAVARGVLGRWDVDPTHHVIELADHGADVLEPDASAVADDLARVAGATLLVVATPVYKGSYTGLLKAFLDRFGHRPLDGVVAVPVVVSAAPAHAAAGDDHLRPLLVELGATVPERSFAVTEAALAGDGGTAGAPLDTVADALVAAWLDDLGPDRLPAVPAALLAPVAAVAS